MGTLTIWLIGWATCSLVVAVVYSRWATAARQRQVARIWAEARSSEFRNRAA